MRSFADGNGDGVGDLRGIREPPGLPGRPRRGRDLAQPLLPLADGRRRLRHRRLPRHRPLFGTLAGCRRADRRGARARDPDDRSTSCRTTAPTSTPGSRQALAAAPRSPQRVLVLVPARPRPGRRRAAEQLAVLLRRPGLDPGDRAGRHPGPVVPAPVRAGAAGLQLGATRPCARSSSSILRFWFDRGVDGFRIDSAALLVKDPLLPDLDPARRAGRPAPVQRPGRHPRDLPGVARGRRLLRRAAGADRRGVDAGPAAVRASTCGPTRCTRRSTSRSCSCAWDAGRAAPGDRPDRCAVHAPVGAPATWVLSNHDVTRHVTRYGRADTTLRLRRPRPRQPAGPGARHPPGPRGGAAVPGAARRRLPLPGRGARALGGRGHPGRAAPGPDVARAPAGANPGRDGCRVPLPWSGQTAAVRLQHRSGADGRSRGCRRSPRRGASYTVEARAGDPDSMLELYRSALRLRTVEPGLRQRARAAALAGLGRAGPRLPPRRRRGLRASTSPPTRSHCPEHERAAAHSCR